MNIRENYLRIKEKIESAALKSGRDPGEIKLVVVTKTHTIDVIQDVIDAGASELGENYVEDAIPKIQSLSNNTGIIWHMVGHIQSRKSQDVAEYFDYIHSLDSLKLAERLNRNLILLNKTLPVWLEINLGGELSKSGWNMDQDGSLGAFLHDFEKIRYFSQLRLLGLMTIPPFSVNPEDSRSYFIKLRNIQEQLRKDLKLVDFNELSMGMSGDFEVAIQEGSTCVRIGQAILGKRNN